MNIECPANMRRHVQKVLAGEYDIPYRHNAPVILDIGANVGSFAAWALKRWPGAHVHCYEPLPDNFALLNGSIRGKVGEFAQLRGRGSEPDPALLGRNNCGEASFYDVGEQSTAYVEVETKAPDVLPKAHIAKIDTEGWRSIFSPAWRRSISTRSCLNIIPRQTGEPSTRCCRITCSSAVKFANSTAGL